MKTLINRINLIAHKLYTTELVERLINEVKSLKTLFILKEKRMITLFDELRNWIETLKEEIVCEWRLQWKN
jgi:hypothetical protein